MICTQMEIKQSFGGQTPFSTIILIYCIICVVKNKNLLFLIISDCIEELQNLYPWQIPLMATLRRKKQPAVIQKINKK